MAKAAHILCAAMLLLHAMAGEAHALLAMRIGSLNDFNLPSWGIGDPSVKSSINICIYSSGNNPSGSYAITVSSPGGYVLKKGAESLPYSLTWNDNGAGNLNDTGTALTNNSKLSGRRNANTLDATCILGGANARLNITVNEADLAAALAGTYTGTLTLMVSAN